MSNSNRRQTRKQNNEPTNTTCSFGTFSLLVRLPLVTAILLTPILIIRMFVSINEIPMLYVAAIQLIHVFLLWCTDWYLALFRSLLLPIRRSLAVSPVFMRRERGPSIYYTPPQEIAGIMKSLRKAVENRLQTIQKNFQANQICHEAKLLESSLKLSEISPLIWRHCQRNHSSNYAGAVWSYWQQLLVLFMLPDKALLDLYYNHHHRLIAVQLTAPQDNHSLHWHMYFSTHKASKSDALFSNAALLAKTRCAYLHNRLLAR